MPSAKQGSIKYHFLSLWYDSTWDWTPVSQTIGKHSNGPVKLEISEPILSVPFFVKVKLLNTFKHLLFFSIANMSNFADQQKNNLTHYDNK